MKRPRLFSLLGVSLLLTAPGLAQSTQGGADIPGVFTAGQWTGQCFRDGYLAGRKHEDCGAILEGPVKIWLFRTVAGLNITLSPQSCNVRPWKTHLKPARLIVADADVQIAGQISRGLKWLSAKCRAQQTSAQVRNADLQEIITLTDGLEF